MIPLRTGYIYHIFNRGVNKNNIFYDESDYKRFLFTAYHYLNHSSKFSYDLPDSEPGSLQTGLLQKIEQPVDVLAYCLMPNHFHLLLKQKEEGGLTWYMHRLLNSYSHYINVKYKRVGTLFQGPFKNVLIDSDEQLLHLSRYIHLNPVVSNLVTELDNYPWSSYKNYIGVRKSKLCDPRYILDSFPLSGTYEDFVLSQVDYGKELEVIKHMEK